MRQFDAAVALFFYALTLLGTYFSTHSCCAVIPVYGYLPCRDLIFLRTYPAVVVTLLGP